MRPPKKPKPPLLCHRCHIRPITRILLTHIKLCAECMGELFPTQLTLKEIK